MIGVYNQLLEKRKKGSKSFAVLIDPDKTDRETCLKTINIAVESKIDFFFVGGSLITNSSLGLVVETIKENCKIPVVLFPGSNHHINKAADAILFLSLISGRNPEYLIGQHVIAAPALKQSGLEIIPTGYMLVDCGKQTTVSYISNTTPLPYDKKDVAVCTAMAGEMLGLRLLYLDGGSGAQKPVSVEMVEEVRQATTVPLIVGGGINTPQKAVDLLSAGADMIVIGNGIEKDINLLINVSEKINAMNLNIH